MQGKVRICTLGSRSFHSDICPAPLLKGLSAPEAISSYSSPSRDLPRQLTVKEIELESLEPGLFTTSVAVPAWVRSALGIATVR